MEHLKHLVDGEHGAAGHVYDLGRGCHHRGWHQAEIEVQENGKHGGRERRAVDGTVEPLKASLCRVYAIVERPTVAEAAHGSKPLGIALQLLRVRLIVDKQTLHHRVLVRINGFQPVDDVGRLHVQLHSKVNHWARTVAFRSCGS